MDLGNVKTRIAKKIEAAKDERPVSEWSVMVDKFVQKLNENRGSFKEMKFARVAKMLEGRPIGYLYKTFKECEEARSFGAMFWYIYKRDKPKKV